MTASPHNFQPDIEAFHPDRNLPGCMMPDGGECCAGHAAVVADWHRQRRRIAVLEMIILEELNPFDCQDEANGMIVQDLHDREEDSAVPLEEEKSHG